MEKYKKYCGLVDTLAVYVCILIYMTTTTNTQTKITEWLAATPRKTFTTEEKIALLEKALDTFTAEEKLAVLEKGLRSN